MHSYTGLALHPPPPPPTHPEIEELTLKNVTRVNLSYRMYLYGRVIVLCKNLNHPKGVTRLRLKTATVN